jgi:hypothetical protein
MSAGAAELWPWLAVAGLGLFHGLNPAMGWLFAVALGLNRGSQRIVLLSLLPITLGHAAAVVVVLLAVLLLGLVVEPRVLAPIAAGVLIAWALWHAWRGHRGKVRVGMQTGLMGLAAWSFMMASAHGAGLMLVPVLLPICTTDAPGAALMASGSAALGLAVLAVHTAAMLATIAIVATVVYRWAGLALLRRAWINLDAIWIAALVLSGVLVLLA